MFPRWHKAKGHCSQNCSIGAPRCLDVGSRLEPALKTLRNVGEGRFLIKTCGLSVLKRTPLGGFQEDKGKGLTYDSLSGIRLCKDGVKLILFRCPLLGCLRVAWTLPDFKVLAYLGFEGLLWESPEAAELREALACKAIAHDGKCTSHCHQWLDDWSGEEPRASHSFDRVELVSLIEACEHIQVKLSNQSIALNTSLTPEVIDMDQNILRISDRSRHQIVYADMGCAQFSFFQNSAVISV